jgi:hypothetical protein
MPAAGRSMCIAANQEAGNNANDDDNKQALISGASCQEGDREHRFLLSAAHLQH